MKSQKYKILALPQNTQNGAISLIFIVSQTVNFFFCMLVLVHGFLSRTCDMDQDMERLPVQLLKQQCGGFWKTFWYKLKF